jgi:hypothetical protein
LLQSLAVMSRKRDRVWTVRDRVWRGSTGSMV